MNTVLRHDDRAYDQLRQIKVSYNVFGYAPGNVLFELGNTKVLCSVMIQRGVPPFLKGKKTYVVGGLMVAYGIIGTILGYQEAGEAGRIIMEGFGFIFLRMGVAKGE